MTAKSKYEELGVDARKAEVKAAFEGIIDSEFRGAFVNIIQDPYCIDRFMTMHMDGDGSKFIQRLLHYMEDGNPEVFRGMVDDAMSMNTSDIAAAGFVYEPWLLADVINIGLPKEIKLVIMQQIAIRIKELKKLYSDYGFRIKFLGGETADLGQQVKSAVFDMAITAWAKREDLILGNVSHGDAIFGFASNGKAAWETEYNSGIMSNGLTLARSALMSSDYNNKYPFLIKEASNFFKGKHYYNFFHDSLPDTTIGNAILSPTRQWPIVIKTLMDALKKRDALHMLHGISINTGGGATKIANLGSNMIFVKDMPTPPELFQLIHNESAETWNNMYVGFNCGIGMDVIGEDKPDFVNAILETSQMTQVKNYHLGHCFTGSAKKNQVELGTQFGEFVYK